MIIIFTVNIPANKTNTPNQPCPQCQVPDQVYKISVIYLESSTRLNYADELGQPELDRLLDDLCPEISDCSERDHLARQFAQVFAPPGAAPATPSRLHPDLMFGIFLLLLLVMVFQIERSQPEALTTALGLLLAGILAYLLGRRWILRRFRSGQAQSAEMRIESALKRWGQLYFCSRDRVIFHPDENQPVPLEQFQTYLHES